MPNRDLLNTKRDLRQLRCRTTTKLGDMHYLILILLFASSTITFAQENGKADGLLREVMSAARAAKCWRAEGIKIEEMTINGIERREEVHFRVALQGTSKMHWETSGADQTTMVCDGTDHWTYYRQPGGALYRSPVSVSPCNVSDVGDFLKLTDGLLSASVIGSDHVQFAGALRECKLVRTEYRRAVHTFCIDPASKMILRDRMEAPVNERDTSIRLTETTTYLSYERNVAIPPDTFRFVAPNGMKESKGP
jgi:outer membrane lipoprotein-sorting protein